MGARTCLLLRCRNNQQNMASNVDMALRRSKWFYTTRFGLGQTRSFSVRNDRYSHSEYEWLIHALVWSEHGTQLLWFRLAFVWCRQQRWRLPRPYCMAHASDATRATLQHCVHICYTSQNCRIHTTRSSPHGLTSRDTNARIKLIF